MNDIKTFYLTGKKINSIIKRVEEIKIDDLVTLPSESLYELATIDGINIAKIICALTIKKDAMYLYMLGFEDKMPIYILAKSIIQCNDLEYMYKFLQKIPSAPVEELKEAILESGNEEYIYYLTQLEILNEIDNDLQNDKEKQKVLN